MGSGFSEAPLAVFTTLAPMGAAAFIVLAAALFMAADKLDEAALRRLDKWTSLPVAVLAVGFIGAFFHLANPLNAFGVFAGVGASPLSNEILMGVLTALVCVVYWACGLAGKLGGATSGVRRGLAAACAVMAVVFAVFCGMAYMMGTIPTWNTPLSVVQMLGFALVGGAVLGAATLAFAKVELPQVNAFAVAMAVAGVVVALVGLGVQAAGLDGIRNIWGSAAQLVPAFGGIIAAFAVCGLVGAAAVFANGRRKLSPALLGAACAVVAVGVFFARIGFYGLYMGIAL